MPGMSGFDAAKEFRKLEAQYGLNEDQRHYICGTSAEVSERKYIHLLLCNLELKKKCEEYGIDNLV